MNYFLQLFQDKLSGIQNSEDHIKRRWAIGISACVMLVVVAMWIGYMNFAIRSVADPSPMATAPLPESPTGPSTLSLLRERMTAASAHTREGISAFFLRLSAPRELEIRK